MTDLKTRICKDFSMLLTTPYLMHTACLYVIVKLLPVLILSNARRKTHQSEQYPPTA